MEVDVLGEHITLTALLPTNIGDVGSTYIIAKMRRQSTKRRHLDPHNRL